MTTAVSNEEIQRIADSIDFAFQPIVSVHSGILVAVEALLRNYSDAGFDSIQSIFDSCYDKELLYQLDLALRHKVIEKFASLPHYEEFKLFYNIDNRVLLMPEYTTGNTVEILKYHGVPHNCFCFELSEKSPIYTNVGIKKILKHYKKQNFFVAIDDYGAGFSGLKQLYEIEPDFLKIDRFFVQGINLDAKKKKFVASIVNLAHVLGVQVIIEGIETAEEFAACREMGCEYVQGFFIEKGQTDISQIRLQYDLIADLSRNEQRREIDDKDMILLEMQRYEPIDISRSTSEDVLNYFRRNSHKTFAPIVNKFEQPVGIIRENILKKYVYSPYGKELLRGKNSRRNINDLVSNAPSCEISTNVEQIIELFNLNSDSVGILLTEQGKYKGFLTARALLKLINQKNVAYARNQNPLTKLPGNLVISEKIAQLKDMPDSVICYFDFDFFKPFNDKYGFRIGDRAIMMFSELLGKYKALYGAFAGHVGGDDFVIIEYNVGSTESVRRRIQEKIVDSFSHDVETLYNEEDRKKKCIEGVDRFGTHRCFPLLTVSCVMADVRLHPVPENIPLEIAEKKKEVKSSDDRIIVF